MTKWGGAIEKIGGGVIPTIVVLDIEMPGANGITLEKRIKELCPDTYIVFETGYSQYALEAFQLYARGYLLKPITAKKVAEVLEHLILPKKNTSRIQICCFGNFEIFVDGSPLQFRLNKTKELLACLVDRQGASLSTAELCAILWEDSSIYAASNFRHLVVDLTKTLEKVNAKEIFIRRRNRYSVDKEKFDCDMYRFLIRDIDAINAYRGEYMSQYSWAELTRGMLEN